MTPMKRRVLHVTDDNERILEDLISPSPFRLTRFSSGQVRPSDELPISHALPSSVLPPSKTKKGKETSLSTACGCSSNALLLNSASFHCGSSNSSSVAEHASLNRSSSTSLGKSLLVAYDGFVLLDGDNHYSVPSSRKQAFELYVELRKCLQFLLPFVKKSSLGICSSPLRESENGKTENNGEYEVNFPCEEELRDKEIEVLEVIFQKKKLRKEAKAAKHFSYSELREKLKALKLPLSGTKGILQSRLKNYYRHRLKEMDAYSSHLSCSSTSFTVAPCAKKRRHSWEARSEKEVPPAIGEEGGEEEEKENKGDLEDVGQLVLSPRVSSTPLTERVSLSCVGGSLPSTTVPRPPTCVGRLSALVEDEPARPTSSESPIQKERSISSTDSDTGEESFRPSFVPLCPSRGEEEVERVNDMYASDDSRIAPPLFSSTSMDAGEYSPSSRRRSSSSLVEFSNRTCHGSHQGHHEDDNDYEDEEDSHNWGNTVDERPSFMEGGVMVSPSTVPSTSLSEECFSSSSASAPMTQLRFHSLSLNEETNALQPLRSRYLKEESKAGRVTPEAKGLSLGTPKESYSRTSEEEEEEVSATGLWGSIKHAGNRLLKSVAPLTPTRHGRVQKRRRTSTE